MPRANRHFIKGCVWHITHRCHKKEFLLKFARDRKRWSHWLFEAKKRYHLCVLNYIVTSNHIHLLVMDVEKDAIPKSLQLIAGRTAQEFNLRKKRKGAFWEDRYHATAVETGEHLAKCLTYIDLNMVRAGVVDHPSEYQVSGYNEIQNPPKRYKIIDIKALQDLFSIGNHKHLQQEHKKWVDSELRAGRTTRRASWSESIAVGSEKYINSVQQQLGLRAKGRSVVNRDVGFTLKEASYSYNSLFECKKDFLRSKNWYFWKTNDQNTS